MQKGGDTKPIHPAALKFTSHIIAGPLSHTVLPSVNYKASRYKETERVAGSLLSFNQLFTFSFVYSTLNLKSKP